MSITIVFAGLMVLVVGSRGCQLLEPLPNILDQPTLMIVHVDGGSNVHRRDEAQAILYTASLYDLLHFICDMHHFATFSGLEDHVFRVALHLSLQVSLLCR